MKKKFKFNGLILLLVTFLVIYLMLKDNFKGIILTIADVNIFYLVNLLLFFILYLVCKALSIYTLAKSISDSKVTFKDVFIEIINSQFFDGITPFASGGEPLKVYMLHKDADISYPKSIGVIISDTLINSVAVVVVGFVAFIFNLLFSFFELNRTIKIFLFIGFLAHLLLLVACVLVSFFPNIIKRVARWTINFLSDKKILKNKESALSKADKYIDDFFEGMKYIKENKVATIKVFIIDIISRVLFLVTAYFALKAINPLANITMFEAIIGSAFIYIIGAFIPISGGTGGIEYGFIYFFKNILNEKELNASCLVWRAVTYYLGLLVGGISFLIWNKRYVNKKEE